jgi:hypothetical protein
MDVNLPWFKDTTKRENALSALLHAAPAILHQEVEKKSGSRAIGAKVLQDIPAG